MKEDAIYPCAAQRLRLCLLWSFTVIIRKDSEDPERHEELKSYKAAVAKVEASENFNTNGIE